jgi:KDO2-lipid IV(A) lauroyltransferase
LVLKGLSKLSFSLQRLLSIGFSWVMMKTIKTRVKVTEVNLRKAFPQASEIWVKDTLKASFDSFALGFMEANATYWLDYSEFSRVFPCTIEGFEHIESAVALGKGLIICGYHLHSLDLVCRMLTEKIERELNLRCALVYQAQKNPLKDHFLYGWRRRYASEVFRRKELKGMLSWLKSGRILLYAPDQDFGPGPSVFAPFMGVSTATVTAPGRMIQHTGAVLLSAWFYRAEEGYVIKILPPLEGYPSGDDLTDATQLNAVYEPLISSHPAQYLWQHRRFKTRPPGESSFYE